MKKRFYRIDLYRLVFALVVLLYHSNLVTQGVKIFSRGYLGVEFFFLISGWFMAAGTQKAGPPVRELGRETTQYIWRKIRKIYPYYLAAFLIAFTVNHIASALRGEKLSIPLHALYGTLELFLLQMSGIRWLYAVNGIAWFLSAMLLAHWVIYPLLRFFRDSFTHVYGPFAALVLLGYLSQKYGSLNCTTVYMDENSTNYFFMQPGLIRALAETILGTSSYALCESIVRRIKTLPPHAESGFRYLLAAAEYLCLAAVLILSSLKINGQSDFLLLCFLFLLVTVCFSGELLKTDLSRKGKIWDLLPNLSMLIFLNQRCWLNLLPILSIESYLGKMLAYLICVALSSLLTWLLGNLLMGRGRLRSAVPRT